MDNFDALRNAVDDSESKTVTYRLKEVVTGNGTIENVKEEVKSKEERMKDLVKSITAIEESIQPYKDQLKDLKKEYVENQWLEKEEIRLVVKALRLVKDETDMDKLLEVYENLAK
jgi:chromosome segregation ATPase